jgi:DNA-binding GntR family transcriptional regulator
VPGEHSRIAELTMARETDEACALLRQHIGRTGENVRLALTAMPSQPVVTPRQKAQARPGAGQTS